MATIEIRKYDHGEGDFWQKMGEFFASPEVRRALGRPMSSKPGYVWWVALYGPTVAGFAALAPGRNKSAELCHAYVLPEYRLRGIYRSLLQARIGYGKERFNRLVTTATDSSRLALKSEGFQHIGYRGRYARMELYT